MAASHRVVAPVFVRRSAYLARLDSQRILDVHFILLRGATGFLCHRQPLVTNQLADGSRF